MAMPKIPNHKPASAITIHTKAVIAGHGASTASTGANRKPAPTYQAEPARSAFSTKVSHGGII